MKAEDIVFWFFFFLTLFLLAWKVFGSSPELEAVVAAAFGSLSTAVFKLYKDFYVFKGRLLANNRELLARLERIEKAVSA